MVLNDYYLTRNFGQVFAESTPEPDDTRKSHEVVEKDQPNRVSTLNEESAWNVQFYESSYPVIKKNYERNGFYQCDTQWENDALDRWINVLPGWAWRSESSSEKTDTLGAYFDYEASFDRHSFGPNLITG